MDFFYHVNQWVRVDSVLEKIYPRSLFPQVPVTTWIPWNLLEGVLVCCRQWGMPHCQWHTFCVRTPWGYARPMLYSLAVLLNLKCSHGTLMLFMFSVVNHGYGEYLAVIVLEILDSEIFSIFDLFDCGVGGLVNL